MSDFSDNVGYATQASFQKLSDLGMGASIGAHKMLSDLGGLIPRSAEINNNQFIQAHHGMYANRMTFVGDAKALMGWGVPRNVSTYDHQQMAYADMGNRVAGATVFGGMQGAVAATTWFGGGLAITEGAKSGWRAGKTWGAAKLAAKGLGEGTVMTAGAGAAGVIGAIGGMAAGQALIYGATKTMDAVINDVKDRQQISHFLDASSWRYAPTHGKDIDSKRGGFNREARANIADEIKQYDFRNSSYDMKDLKGILEGGTELGMFNGAQDAKDFGDKFKKLADTLKTVTKTLHTSLAEGMKVIKSLKGAGIGSNDVTGAIMQGDVLGMASGKTAAEMLSYGTQGAEMVRGTGVATAAGFNMMQSNMTSTTLGARSGTLSAGAIEQAGGIGALAQQTMAQRMNFMNSSMGRGMMLAASSKSGKLDSSAVSDLLNGGMSLSDIASAAKGNVGNSGDYIRNLVNQGSRRRELSQSYGGRGMELMALSAHVINGRQIAKDHNVDDLTGFKLSLKQSGASDSVIANNVSMFKNLESERRETAIANSKESRRILGEVAARKMDVIGKASDRLYANTIGAAGKGFNSAFETIASTGEEMMSATGTAIKSFMTGTKIVKLNSMTEEERITAMLSGSPYEEIAIDPKLESSNFSEGEAISFGKSKAFDKIRSRVGGNIYSAKAGSAKTANDYSKAIFGKGFSDISKEEKMFLSTNINRMGSKELKENFDEKISSDMSKRELAMSEYLDGKLGKEEDLEDAFNSSITGALQHMGTVGSGYNKVGAHFALSGIVSSDKKGYIGILKQKKKIADLKTKMEEEKSAMKGLGNYDDTSILKSIASEKKKLEVMGQTFLGKSGKVNTNSTQAIGKLVQSDLSDSEKKVLEAEGDLETLKNVKNRTQLAVLSKQGMDNYLRKGSSSSKLDADERTDFSELFAKFKSGTSKSGDLEDLLDLSKKAGVGGLTNTLTFGKQFREASDGKQMNFGKFEDFLKSSRGIEITPEEKAKLGKEWKDGVSQQEAMQFITGKNQIQSGPKAFGGLSTSDSRKEEAQLMNNLSKVQYRTAEVYGLLEVLANKLLKAK